MSYILYKNPIQIDTLEIVQYLYSLGHKDAVPNCCIERNHPSWVTQLPSIETDQGMRYIGLQQSIFYYETSYKIKNLMSMAHKFKSDHPDFRIHE